MEYKGVRIIYSYIKVTFNPSKLTYYCLELIKGVLNNVNERLDEANFYFGEI